MHTPTEEEKRPACSTVTVIVPIRNEEKYIAKCLQSLVMQTYAPDLYEILVVDGRSSDRSVKIVQDISSVHNNVRLLDNPAATAPAGMNIGIRNAKGDIVIRADGHNFYPSGYVENCVKCLNETGADNVGGPWITVPANDSFGARLVAAVLTNPFGVGNSNFRIGSKEGFVETVPFGAFRRELFDRIGIYNENLVRNQDNELNARIRRHGGKIYQTPTLTTKYHPTANFRDFLSQTFKQSQWHVFSVRENIFSMSPRHFAPGVFVSAIAICGALGTFDSIAFYCLMSITAAYLVLATCFSVRSIWRLDLSTMCVLPLAFGCFHIAYGLGTLIGLKYVIMTPSKQPIRAGQSVT